MKRGSSITEIITAVFIGLDVVVGFFSNLAPKLF